MKIGDSRVKVVSGVRSVEGYGCDRQADEHSIAYKRQACGRRPQQHVPQLKAAAVAALCAVRAMCCLSWRKTRREGSRRLSRSACRR